MRRLKQFFGLAPAVFLIAGAFFFLPKEGPYVPPTPKQNIFDTSLTILKHFVIAGDYRLGFLDTNEMAGAWVDTANGIPLYYAVIDSFAPAVLTSDGTSPAKNEGMVYLSRKMFPVYGREGFLRSAITFDSSQSGWIPVEFDNGAAIRVFTGFRNDPRAAHGGKIVLAPFLQGEFYVAKDTNDRETAILRSSELAELRKFLPQKDSAVLPEVDLVSAVQALKQQH